MKKSKTPIAMKDHPSYKQKVRDKGFALISTILIMSLLLILALAMMSYSSTVTKESTIGRAHEEARANAKIALLTAIGKLQAMAGPDQVATGTGWLTGEDAKHRHLAGIWESYRVDPLSPPADYDAEKENRFKGWLVSNSDETALTQRIFALNGEFTDPVNMLGQKTLGSTAAPEDFVYAGRIPINGRNGQLSGHMAYVGFDESVKVRANLALDKVSNSMIERVAKLGSSSRAAIEKILPPAYDPVTAETEKFITLPEMKLGTEVDLGKHTHDLSVWSKGVMSNVVDGGLRDDLNLAADGATGAEFLGQRVYEDTLKANPSGPYWQQILDYVASYKSIESVGGIPQVTARLPEGYVPVTGSGTNITVNKESPNGMVLMPVVAKVQVVFSVTSRRAHGGWGGQIRPFQYMLYLTYSPVVTLYNPYNVALTFDQMNIKFQDVPIGFNFYRNGNAQSTKLMPLNKLYVWNFNTKSFSMSIKNGVGSSGSGSLVLKPGESRVFSPYFPPNYSWNTDRNGDGQKYFDWRNNQTSNIEGVPGWEGEGIGFSIDWLTPTSHMTPQDADRRGVFALHWNDKVRVEFGPTLPTVNNKTMTVTSSLTAGSKTYPASVIEMDYGSSGNLSQLLNSPAGSTYFYPADGEATVSCGQLYESGSTPISDYVKGRPFAVFSVYAKTPNGGGVENVDGRYYNKSWSFTNPLSTVNSAELDDKGIAALHSYEMNLETLPGSADEHVQVDGNNRGNFVTGHSALKGLKFGTHSELPIGPIFSVANLQNANLCASGYFPKFDYAVANSLSHPLITINKVKEGDMLDHSYLLNHYLYDRFYCSTIADLSSAAFKGSEKRTALKVFDEFASDEKKLLDRRFSFWSPAGGTDKIRAFIPGAPEVAYKMIAATQMIEGPWNVNSLSVDGWKMVLAGLHGTDFPIYDALSNAILSKTDATNPFSRFSLPNGGTNANLAVKIRKDRWAGYAELTDDELERLAVEIVKEVRNRGPFLSLTEFVNRRLSGDKEMMLKGALETAIDNASVNSDFAADGRTITSQNVAPYNFKNPDAAIGDSTQGAPGRISQGHIMNTLGNAVTVRSDTYTIRAYGDSVDAKGNVLARAWCEAVVQRVPDYVDSADMAFVKPADLASDLNKKFGRRFYMVAFRWLSSAETDVN